MEKITQLLDKLGNLGELVPKLDTLTGWFQWLISLAVRVGPICILVLGLIYLLIPPKEANHKAGYRTYFGMGSVMAWRFTQLVSGALMTFTGLILTIAAFITVGKFKNMDLMEMANKAFSVIKFQVICALIIFVLMFVLTALVFDRKGDCRFPSLMTTKWGKWLFREETAKVKNTDASEYAQQPDPQVFETQGDQVITADDIVIEGIE